MQVPKHVAIVMDGNGRWATQRKLSRTAGHKAGVESVQKIIEASLHQNIPVLTLFAFGVDNWSRPEVEVNFLMRLLVQALEENAEKLQEQNIRLLVIGGISQLPKSLQKKINAVENDTADNDRMKLVIAVNYSGQWDITHAMKTIAEKVASGEIESEDINAETINFALSTGALPPPDLFIRTGGELRISNFMLWQLAYTELYFTDILWPDFDEDAFAGALQAFGQRQRRFGLTGEQVGC